VARPKAKAKHKGRRRRQGRPRNGPPVYRRRSGRDQAVTLVDGNEVHLGRFRSPESFAAYHRLHGHPAPVERYLRVEITVFGAMHGQPVQVRARLDANRLARFVDYLAFHGLRRVIP
jgi:hypothetical protein